MKNRLLLFNSLSIIFMEIFFKIFVFKNIFEISTIYIIIMDLILTLILTMIETIFPKTINKILSIIITFFITILIVAQFIYFKYYDAIFSIYSLFHGAQVFGFMESILGVIWQNIIQVIVLFIPLIVFFILFRKLNFERRKYSFYILTTIIAIELYIIFSLLLSMSDKNRTYSSYSLYYNSHVPKLAVKDFGLYAEMRLDLQRTLFGFDEKIDIEVIEEEPKPIEEKTKYHVMNIDFNTLIENESDSKIKSMHEYFKNVTPSKENEYTGMFKDKNLIVIVAEAFSPMAIDEELTPTLYKLYNEGFTFTNFYTPVFFVSTSDGEYTTLQSLIPKEGSWSMSISRDNYLPFSYGNLLKNYGYTTRAYHDGVASYYNRHLSLPNMGYEYKACYRDLDINCNIWPQSDVEMIEKSVPDYINDEKFMTYYMTVSGHLHYTFMGNSMASKNRKFVENIDANENIRAYLATQIELDRAVQRLIEMLDENGRLDDTVIALSADHYPYGLKTEDIVSYSNYVQDTKFDIHKNAFLLWNNNMDKNITIDKYASSLDALPTILNLLGVEYDSRLVMGRDILGDDEGLIIFNDRSWITSKGKYNAVTRTFTPYEENVDDDYVDKMNKSIYNKYLMSKMILDNNYYAKVLSKEDFIQKEETN